MTREEKKKIEMYVNGREEKRREEKRRFSGTVHDSENNRAMTANLSFFTTPSVTHLNDSHDAPDIFNTVSRIVGALILSLAFLLGFPGNLFIIFSIMVQSHKRSITTLLILNLAFADGCLMAITFFFVVYVAVKNWIFGRFLCKALFFLCKTNMYASIMLIMLMSLHRLVVIVWPQRVSVLKDRRAMRHLLVGLWILVPLLSLPPVVFRDLQHRKDLSWVCMPNHTLPQYVVLQYTMETVVGFLIPYVVIVCSYVCILRHLRRTQFKRRIRSENLILGIVVFFGIFWLPYHFINVIQVVATLTPEDSTFKNSLDRIWSSGRTVASSVAFISSCVNPVFYTFAARSYIRSNGLSFMARLFEGTGRDLGLKKLRQRDAFGLKSLDSSSSSGTAANKK
ncbi:leukotriene B4 receptor 1-like [Denticeps clupeoides]|uniref:leukotriene B4 receptor 1-like n=1 Tax=Denticeps clupeoides TaxID=299321 RepID=UPI0010A4B4F0|nr:leukotriene B4 receptor 1-like [Denticeps clupeoides]